MKRVGHLMEKIADMENLRESFLLAAKGKNCQKAVVAFREHFDLNLAEIHNQLLDGSYRFGGYNVFTIHDPKERQICAAPFRDRITFHAILRICYDIFERYQMSHSYANRIGKGTYKAIEQAQCYCRKYQWFLKMDVCKFFDSIDHECMKAQLARLIKDRLLLAYFDMLIDGYETSLSRGLPIGNLTSQYFANHYLAVADHYVKEKLHVDAVVRYMDDVVIWGNDRNVLLNEAKAYRDFVVNNLKLKLHPFCMNRTTLGMSFLGYTLYPKILHINARSRIRYRKCINIINSLVTKDKIDQREALQRVNAMLAFVSKAHVIPFLRQCDEKNKNK